MMSLSGSSQSCIGSILVFRASIAGIGPSVCGNPRWAAPARRASYAPAGQAARHCGMARSSMLEKAVERLIFTSRWLMAPFYLGLIAVLAVLMVKFAQEVWHFVPYVLDLKETDVILMTLSLL